MNIASDITVLINAIRDLSKVGICYYDLNNFFHYNKWGIKNNRGHYCAFCENTRALPGGRESCEKSDRIEAVRLAMQYKEPFFFECHMGMKELVVPLLLEDELLGIIFVGQCRIQGDNRYNSVRKSAQRLGEDGDKMLKLYQQLPLLSQDDLLNVGKILSKYFDAKVLSNQLFPSEIVVADSGSSLAYSIKDYIDANFSYNISPKSLAEEFFVNPSYASRCFSQKHGITLTEYVHKVRIDRAKVLLQSTNAPVNNIAINVGYIDVNYFFRIFKKQVGVTPKEYRKMHQKAPKA